LSRAVGPLLLAALWLAVAGCNSIYHRTQATLPPGPSAELRMRMDEAQQAENRAAQAGAKLRDDLVRGVSGETVQADLDRLELAAFELQRRTAAAQEVTAAAKEPPELAGEIGRLHLRSIALLDCVHAARKADRAAQVARLDELLRSPVAPATSATR
jgi:hypothetical protein